MTSAFFPGGGRGSGHPARLTFGDCFASALAKIVREPPLFKGDDFVHTDVAVVPTRGDLSSRS